MSLRQQRLKAGLALADVARCFPRSVTYERVRQIELKRSPSSAEVRDFEHAIASAVETQRQESIIAKIVSQFANHKIDTRGIKSDECSSQDNAT
jgi:predicted regulator of amino acid metabolism with ACT domain